MEILLREGLFWKFVCLIRGLRFMIYDTYGTLYILC